MSRPPAALPDRPAGGGIRGVRVAVAFGTAVAVSSEVLGAGSAFARGPLAAIWICGVVGSGAVLWRRRRNGGSWDGLRRPGDPAAVFAVVCILVVLAVCLFSALRVPPNNGDALAYHLPRVRHWIQNHGFAHYPTADLRQISYPPGGSYLVAQLELLTGGDRLASLPQWLALVGCVLVTAALARRLAGPRAIVPTALACATAPMAVLEAMNPQTDLVAAFWLACFVYLLFARARHRAGDVVWMGLALGLGLATKPTILLFAPPFLAILALRELARGWRRGLAVPLAVGLVAIVPTLPGIARNVGTFGRPLGPDLGVVLHHRNPRTVASNLLRNAALDLPFVPVWKAVRWAHAHLLRLDPSDPTTTFPPATKFDVHYLRPLLSPDEDFAASPLHLILGLGATAALLVRRGRRSGRGALRIQLAAALAGGFVLYCLALPWQPFANRLLLPLLVLGSPLVGWALAAVAPALRTALGALLGIGGVLVSLTSVRHPLLPPLILRYPRGDLYFALYGPEVEAQYETVLHQAMHDGCTRVGLASAAYAPEYFLWATLDRMRRPFQLREVQVDNES